MTIDSLCERAASLRTADIRRIVRRDTAVRARVDVDKNEPWPAFEASAG